MGFGAILPFLNRCIMSMSLTLKSTLRHSDSLMMVSSKSSSSSSGIPQISRLNFLVYYSRSSSFVSRRIICSSFSCRWEAISSFSFEHEVSVCFEALTELLSYSFFMSVFFFSKPLTFACRSELLFVSSSILA